MSDESSNSYFPGSVRFMRSQSSDLITITDGQNRIDAYLPDLFRFVKDAQAGEVCNTTTLYYQFPMNPFCHRCLFTMMCDRQPDDRDEHGVIRTWTWCPNERCPQFEKRFQIPPLSVEVPA